MGHFIFIMLHLIALLFTGAILLFVTIPLHLIYASSRKSRRLAADQARAPTRATHVKCPDCREVILKDARVCKHCGCKLDPLPSP